MGIATYSYNRSTSGGEIITHLVNSTDGQGLDFANGALLQLAYAAGGVFGTADFSIEFIIDQSSANSNNKILYTSGGSSEFQITSETGSSKIELTFDGTDYDFSYDMSADYGSPVHYVMTFDRSALATLYKDGNSVATVDISGSSSVNLDNTGTAAGYLGGTADYGVTGVFYRWRTWKKLLSAAEVIACYENASVPITDQWSNCVTDLDFAFANPEMSLQIQSRSGAGDATASVGISQVTPIEQLNSKSARIGTSAATPADGDLLVSGKVGINTGSPEGKLHVVVADAGVAPSSTADVAAFEFTAGAGIDGISLLYPDDKGGQLVFGTPADNDAGRITYSGPTVSTVANRDSMRFYTAGTEKLKIDSAGLCSFSSGIAFQSATTGTGTSSEAFTLDKYESGIWSPAITGHLTAGAYTGVTVVAGYVRVGKLCTVTCQFYGTSGTGTGDLVIGGLPFPMETTASVCCTTSIQANSGLIYPNDTIPCLIIATSTTLKARLTYNNGNAFTYLAYPVNPAYLRFTLTYVIA